jgi:hypothetical protein
MIGEQVTQRIGEENGQCVDAESPHPIDVDIIGKIPEPSIALFSSP